MQTFANTLFFHRDRPVRMIAHRGLSGIEQENTNAAFVAAGNRSYYGIETDVHVTRDGEFILIHNDTTAAVAGVDLPVEQSDYGTLRALQLQDRGGLPGRTDQRMPSFAEYIGICKRYGKVAVTELKNRIRPQDTERLVEVVRAADHLSHTVFISFCFENLTDLRRIYPEAQVEYLAGKWDERLPDLLASHRFGLDIDFSCLTEERIQRLHTRDVTVNAYTVNDPSDAERLAAWGIDEITSNILE